MCKNYNQDNYSYEEVLELTKQGIEIWRRVVIDDIVSDYEVSNLGRIKSLKDNLGGGKRIGYGNKKRGSEYMTKCLSYTDKNGNKKHKRCYIHRLVASAFIPNPENKPEVDHILPVKINGINNKVDNLRWSTEKENINNTYTRKNISKGRKDKTLRNLIDEEKYPYVTEEDILVEEWKPIKGYEGIYEISNMGRVKGLGFKKNSRSRYKKGLLQPTITKNEKGENEYQKVNLTDKNGNRDGYFVHRLVAEHFIPNPENKPEVDHISTKGMDNRYFNLRWSTHKENMGNLNTRKNLSKPIIVLDRHGNILSSGLGICETAKNIGISEYMLWKLLKSHKPYKGSIKNGGNDTTSLRSLNGIRVYYIDEYNEEEVLKEISEDKTDYSYNIGDLICIYPDSRISEPMSGMKLAKELGVGETLVYRLRDSKNPYRPRNKKQKHLEGIRIMKYEDYLKEQKPVEATIEEVNKKYNQTDFFDDYKLYLNF